THPEWKPCNCVILNGWGLGETHLGAYGEKARVKGDWLVPLPSGMSARDAMAIGTAGYTAMLAVMARGRRRGRRGGRDRAARTARLFGRRIDRPPAGGGLPQAPRRDRDHRPGRA